MKIKILFIFILLFSLTLVSTTRNSLEEIMPPEHINVDKDYLYFTSGSTVSIFSLKNLKLIKSFGKKGEGPGEFILFGDDLGMLLDVQTDKIAVSTRRKISYFTKQGKFVKEIKALKGFYHIPVEENIVALRNTVEDKIVYSLVTIYDSSFNKLKDIHRKKNWFQQGKGINPVNVRPPVYCSHKGRVFTEDGKGNINIFSKKGDRLSTTKVNIDQVKITEQDKKGFHNYYKTHPVYKNLYAQLKHLIKFPEYYPRIKFFDVSDSKIYLMSHVRKKNKNELYVFDLNGKLLKKLFVEMPDLDPQDVFPVIRVRNNKIYQIIENEEDEEIIDLFITKIKL